jgi:hypothetical protein
LLPLVSLDERVEGNQNILIAYDLIISNSTFSAGKMKLSIWNKFSAPPPHFLPQIGYYFLQSMTIRFLFMSAIKINISMRPPLV